MKAAKRPDPQKLIRPLVRRLHPYVPGEQPKIPSLIKLNTNENPYPPSPRVLQAIRGATDGRLRLYPSPTADALRAKLAKLHRCKPENILVGNGSDEVLSLAVRAFVEPASADQPEEKCLVQYFSPSYSLYPVLADIQGAKRNAVSLNADFGLPNASAAKKRGWRTDAALSLVTTPNAPSGRGYSRRELEALCAGQRGVVLLDEAYVDFAGEDALPLALKHRHVLAARTFSKAYSLCFQRVGYCVGRPELIEALLKVKDSYNTNGLGQVAALASLEDLGYYRDNFRRIIVSRELLANALTGLGFEVFPSQTNFILTRPPKMKAEQWLAELRKRNILVRWFNLPEVRDYLRITIGTEAEVESLLQAVQTILS